MASGGTNDNLSTNVIVDDEFPTAAAVKIRMKIYDVP
jgi:hypothetical protein